jgi:hypothetical protein
MITKRHPYSHKQSESAFRRHHEGVITGRARRLAGSGAALLAASLAACGTTPQGGEGPANSSLVTSPAPQPPNTQGVVTEPASGTTPPPVSVRTIRLLARQGTDVTVVPATGSPGCAVAAARRAFGSLHDAVPAGVSLARVTVHDYGTRHPEDPERLDLIINDRLAWVVVFDGFTQQPGGPIRFGESSATPVAPTSARIASFIDAHTCQWLSAETL